VSVFKNFFGKNVKANKRCEDTFLFIFDSVILLYFSFLFLMQSLFIAITHINYCTLQGNVYLA